MTRAAPLVAGTFAALLMLFGTYLGSYYALLKRSQTVQHGGTGSVYVVTEVVEPVYRVDKEYVGSFYKAAHSIDRLIRPHYWPDSKKWVEEIPVIIEE